MAQKSNKISRPSPGNLKRLADRMKTNLIDFCQLTNVHGFQYMINDKITNYTRIFFAIACCCSMSLCLYLIILQIFDNNAKSILTSITSTAYPIWKVRFPAVTICNVNTVHQDNIPKFKKIIESYQINNDLVDDFLLNLKALVNFEEVQNPSRYDEILLALNNSGYDIDDMMRMLTPPCSDMIKKCSWQTHNVSCSEIFQPIKTTHGYCCSFNYYGTERFVQNLTDKKNIRYLYVKGAGSTFSLHVQLNSDASKYTSTLQNTIGFTVLVQDSFSYPDLDFISNTLEQDTFMTISVSPNIFVSGEPLRSIPIKSRNCMFEDEGKLRWSSIYTYSNCINECLTNAIFKYCKCIPFYYPDNHEQRICTLKDNECLRNNKYNYSALINPDDFSISPENMNEEDSIVMSCKCFPQCNENMLDFHVDQSKTSGALDSNVSILNVFYNDIGCIKTEREIYFTWDRVLASIGGIFGLCIGGSLISILEVMYFFAHSFIYCEKTKTKASQTLKTNKFPRLYVQDFNHHQQQINYINNLKKAPIMPSKIQIIFNGMNQ